MLELLLLIPGCYLASALLVHLAFRTIGNNNCDDRHVVLVADEGQGNMEWHLRKLLSFVRLTGKDVQLTIVDRGISEETKEIVKRWSHSRHPVRIHVPQEPIAAPFDSFDGKRFQEVAVASDHMLWRLQEEGVVRKTDHAVLIDLQNPNDLSKMLF